MKSILAWQWRRDLSLFDTTQSDISSVQRKFDVRGGLWLVNTKSCDLNTGLWLAAQCYHADLSMWIGNNYKRQKFLLKIIPTCRWLVCVYLMFKVKMRCERKFEGWKDPWCHQQCHLQDHPLLILLSGDDVNMSFLQHLPEAVNHDTNCDTVIGHTDLARDTATDSNSSFPSKLNKGSWNTRSSEKWFMWYHSP